MSSVDAWRAKSVPPKFRDDETAKRWRSGWQPWGAGNDPVQFEQALHWSPRAPLPSMGLRF